MHPIKIVQGVTLYFSLYSAPCRTVLLTLNHLKINLTPGGLRKLNIHEKQEQLEPWFEKINYEKTIPTLIDDGLILWESRAIAKYLVQKYASADNKSLYPSDIADQARVDRLLYFDQGTLSRSITEYFKYQAIYKDSPNPILGADIERGLQLLENIVSRGNFALSGAGGRDHLTIADFSILASLSELESLDYSYDHYNAIVKYVEFLKDHIIAYRESFQEGVSLMRDWARSNFKYLPRYLHESSALYDHKSLVEKRI